MSRRKLLRGGSAGAAVFIGLPLLDAMLNDSGDALAQGAPLPSRFVLWSWGTGLDLNTFEPRAAAGSPIDTGNALAPALRHFAGLENEVTICSGLNLPTGVGATDPHHVGRVGRISGTKPVPGVRRTDSHWGGPSIDQIIATKLIESGVQTPIASLQLAVSSAGASDVGDTGSTAKYLAMRRGSTPDSLVGLQNEKNPQRVWRTLFGGVNPPGHKRSILDFIRSDLELTAPTLGAKDRARLEAHLESIRQVELRMDSTCAQPTQPLLDNEELVGEARIAEVNYVMAELVALAFECDITRVVSMEFSRIAGDIHLWQAPGVTENVGNHFLSHESGSLLDMYHAGADYTVLQLSDWIFRLKGTDRTGAPVGTGTNFLDSTILYATSDVAWGSSHQQARAPIILAGTGMKDNNPYLRPGQHYIRPGAVLGPTDQRHSGSVPFDGSSSDVLLTCVRCFDPAAISGVPTAVGDYLDNPVPANPQGASGTGITELLDPSQV
jgi:Protein of unknown function (DUF1552)